MIIVRNDAGSDVIVVTSSLRGLSLVEKNLVFTQFRHDRAGRPHTAAPIYAGRQTGNLHRGDSMEGRPRGRWWWKNGIVHSPAMSYKYGLSATYISYVLWVQKRRRRGVPRRRRTIEITD